MSQDQLFLWKSSLGGLISWVGQSLRGSPRWGANSVCQVDGVSDMAPACQFCGSVEGWFRIGTMASACLYARHFSFSLYTTGVYTTGVFQVATPVLELRWNEWVSLSTSVCGFFFYFFYLFLERIREGEKHQCMVTSRAPLLETWRATQACPRHVPWLGIKPATLWFTGRCSIHWATQARAVCGFFKRNYLGLQKFLPPTQSPLVFVARCCRDSSSCHRNPVPGWWGWCQAGIP